MRERPNSTRRRRRSIELSIVSLIAMPTGRHRMTSMTTSQTVEDPRTGDPTVDGEHATQLQLLDSIEQALAAGDRERALEAIFQLDVLTEAHFASEQILMRRHSYPGYWRHEEEHGHLMEELLDLRERIGGAEPTHLAAEAGAIRAWLMSHMLSSDASFAAFIAASPEGPKG